LASGRAEADGRGGFAGTKILYKFTETSAFSGIYIIEGIILTPGG
jgi:hypothetical protein